MRFKHLWPEWAARRTCRNRSPRTYHIIQSNFTAIFASWLWKSKFYSEKINTEHKHVFYTITIDIFLDSAAQNLYATFKTPVSHNFKRFRAYFEVFPAEPLQFNRSKQYWRCESKRTKSRYLRSFSFAFSLRKNCIFCVENTRSLLFRQVCNKSLDSELAINNRIAKRIIWAEILKCARYFAKAAHRTLWSLTNLHVLRSKVSASFPEVILSKYYHLYHEVREVRFVLVPKVFSIILHVSLLQIHWKLAARDDARRAESEWWSIQASCVSVHTCVGRIRANDESENYQSRSANVTDTPKIFRGFGFRDL